MKYHSQDLLASNTCVLFFPNFVLLLQEYVPPKQSPSPILFFFYPFVCQPSGVFLYPDTNDSTSLSTVAAQILCWVISVPGTQHKGIKRTNFYKKFSFCLVSFLLLVNALLQEFVSFLCEEFFSCDSNFALLFEISPIAHP